MAEKKLRNQNFDLTHHGDEVIVTTDGDGVITIRIKIQTGMSEHRSILMSFETQTQLERLLPPILKGLQTK